ncbi:adenylosuccinate synthase [bacterium]|nr:adenylosuccinate synthase [bacterium]
MSASVLLGLQWGDEGKGKITDYLASQADIVLRFQGGDNAGHTLLIDGKKYFNHLIPSGIMYDDKLSIIGNGVVVNPATLVKEIAGLKENGISAKGLRVSEKCHLITPFHIALDGANEMRKGSIGTTKKGIGPAYSDKAARRGIRFLDLLDGDGGFQRYESAAKYHSFVLKEYFGIEPPDIQDSYDKIMEYLNILKTYICNTEELMFEAYEKKTEILFEGAQGILLDLDHGTYPFVTSSNTVSGAALCGSGYPLGGVKKITGVFKSYTTRVGDGPFATELFDDISEAICEKGGEYGTTTGRKRRVGWADIVDLKRAVMLSGTTDLAMTKADVLCGMDKVLIAESRDSANKPLYKEFEGWGEITPDCNYSDLPENLKKYIEYIEEQLRVPINIISYGPARRQTIER